MKQKKKYLIVLSLFLLFIFIFPFLSYGVAPDQNFFKGSDVRIDKIVDGPVFATGQRVHINSEINGPVFISAGKVKIDGKINGTVFLLGGNITVNGEINGDLFAAGKELSLESPSIISRDTFLVGNTVLLNSILSRHAMLVSNNFSFGEEVNIGGNFYYSSSGQPANIQEKVSGNAVYSPFSKQINTHNSPLLQFARNLLTGIISFGAMGYLLGHFTKKRWMLTLYPVMNRPVATFSMGVFSSITIPPLLVLLFILVLFRPLAIILTLLVGLVIVTSVMVVSFSIAKKLSGHYISLKKYYYLPGFAIVYTLLQILMAIPYAGFLLRFILFFLAFGNVMMNLYLHDNKRRIIAREKNKFLQEQKNPGLSS